MSKYNEVKFVAKQYKNKKWTVWISRDGQKFMIGSDFNEMEFISFLGRLEVEREYYVPKIDQEKEELKKKVEELEKYKAMFENVSRLLKSVGDANHEYLLENEGIDVTKSKNSNRGNRNEN